MRNLKKVLSLVLCVAMLLSVMVMGTGAVTLTDSEDISPQYREAAEVLTGMGIINGYEDDSFKPQQSITRAEVATMIYRAATSDVTDSQTGLYVDYDKFTDVTADDWYAGYVNFCGNAELIKGFEDDSFRATENVTGYQVLAMILRAVGYDQNGEFTGTGWEIRTASTAQSLGILKNVQEATLGSAATRELVAELIFQALNVPTVTYMPAIGYVEGNETLGEQEFDLTQSAYTAIDEWGRPGYEWYADSNNNNTLNDNETVYATIEAVADATYTEAVTECDIAADTNVTGNVTYPVTVNGQSAINYEVQATDTVQKIGAQGRLTEVYYNYDGEGSDAIIMIDTFLAYVDDVDDATFDANNHLRTSASIDLVVYDGTSNGRVLTLTNGSTNYDYAVGDMVLVNAYTSNANVTGSGSITGAQDSGEIVGLADSIVGAQTVIHHNDGQHTISGTTYDDAAELHLDQAGTETVNHTWYFDQYDNLIGVTDIATTYSYGTIKDIQWVNPTGADGYAQATMVYMDGSEQTQTIASINDFDTAYNATYTPGYVDGTNIYVSTTKQDNYAQFGGVHMYQIETNSDGSLDLTTTYELQNATVRTGISIISNDSDSFYTNSATQYLVKSGSGATATYTPMTGYTNIDTYGTATVDYAVVDENGFAQYVYITGTPDRATSSGLFYLSTNAYREVLDVENGNTVDYYELTGYVDGVAGTIRIAGDRESIKDAIIGHVGDVFIVNYTDGEVTSLGNSNNPISGFVDLDDVTGYADQYIRYVPADSAKVVLENGVLQITQSGTTDAYNVVGQVNVLGDMPADGDISDKNVHVVYRANGTAFEAVQVYISDKALTGSDGTEEAPADPTTATVNYVLNVQYGTSGLTTSYLASETLESDNPLLGVSTQYLANWAVISVQEQNNITISDDYQVIGVTSYTKTVNAGDTVTFVFTIRV